MDLDQLDFSLDPVLEGGQAWREKRNQGCEVARAGDVEAGHMSTLR